MKQQEGKKDSGQVEQDNSKRVEIEAFKNKDIVEKIKEVLRK